MKRKIIFCTFALTTLLLSGCAQQNEQTPDGSAATEQSTTNSSATDSAMDPATQNSTTDSSAPDATTPSTDSAGVATQTPTDMTQHNGTTGEKITEEEAKQIALTHAGLTSEQVTFIKSGMDRDNGRENYDIEFYSISDQKEYDYEIDPYSGTLLEVDYDAEYYPQTAATHDTESITAEKAKELALAEVPGAKAEDIREFKSDYDNGKLEYEGKIFYDQKEYEFEIDGHTGEIREWDIEPIYGGAS